MYTMKKHLLTTLLLGAGLAYAAIAHATDVTYTADNTSIFPNPERGFITMLEGKLSAEKHYAVKGKESYLDNHRNNDRGSLVLVLYYLDNFKDCDLPDWVLNAFDEDMAVLRARGMKCILRFAYTNTTYKYPNPDPTRDSIRSAADAPLSVIEKHIDQYKQHWADNTDVIFVFQAGFVGAYGEWYYTDNFTNTSSHMTPERTAFLDTLLKAVPENRCIQIRTPRFKEEYISGERNGHPAALTPEEAYTGTAKARIAHHNDAFLYHYDNMGTYSDTSIQKPYLAQETLYLPIGGESDITDADQAAVEAAHDVTIAEMSRLHWTFIQSGYSRTVTDMWRANGTFDELNQKLGYRYQLVSGSYSEALNATDPLSVIIQIRNAGFAPLYNERPAYIVLKNDSKTYFLPLASDPRTWLPNGVVSTVNEQLALPAGIENGIYQLYLYLPDAYESIADNPRYAVRFANTGVWDAEAGMNDLGASVTISGGEEPEDTSVLIPATLNKFNASAWSPDMTWYGEYDEYFDFGPTDASNLGRWAEWTIRLAYPGNYIVSATGYYPNGHEWAVVLLNSEADSLHFTRTWKSGEVTEVSPSSWNLSAPNVPAGVYTLQVKNVFPYSQPKLLSLTLQYDGELPTTSDIGVGVGVVDGMYYDLLGRRVSAGYKGIVIHNGSKILLR